MDGKRGFTLLEMLLAVTLLAGGTVALMALMQRAQVGMAEGESTLIATQLAQRRLEELRNTAYASLTSEAKAAVTSPSGFTRFSREVTVTEPQANLKQLVVTVYWNAPGGETNVSFRTYRSAN